MCRARFPSFFPHFSLRLFRGPRDARIWRFRDSTFGSSRILRYAAGRRSTCCDIDPSIVATLLFRRGASGLLEYLKNVSLGFYFQTCMSSSSWKSSACGRKVALKLSIKSSQFSIYPAPCLCVVHYQVYKYEMTI